MTAGDAHSLALKTDGTISGWGRNDRGQVGDGSQITPLTPVATSGITNVVQISAGAMYSMALRADGTVWAWGDNSYGQLGDGLYNPHWSPHQGTNLSGVSGIAAGMNHALAVKPDGTVWSWGWNFSGQLGTGSTSPPSNSTPAQVPGLQPAVSVAGANTWSFALTSDGSIWIWGDGNPTSRELFHATGATVLVAGLHHNLALIPPGTIMAWGGNDSGQLGDGTFNSSSQTYVSEIGDAVRIAANGWHSLAVRADGSVWSWGRNDYGQLGDGSFTNRPSPVRIARLDPMTSIGAGAWHSLAVAGP